MKVDSIIRNAIAILILVCFAMLIDDKFVNRTLAIAFMFVALSIIASNIAVWAFTQINFIHERATNELSRIYLGTSILIGLVVAGAYFVQVQ